MKKQEKIEKNSLTLENNEHSAFKTVDEIERVFNQIINHAQSATVGCDDKKCYKTCKRLQAAYQKNDRLQKMLKTTAHTLREALATSQKMRSANVVDPSIIHVARLTFN
jgi:hypothetical protein